MVIFSIKINAVQTLLSQVIVSRSSVLNMLWGISLFIQIVSMLKEPQCVGLNNILNEEAKMTTFFLFQRDSRKENHPGSGETEFYHLIFY